MHYAVAKKVDDVAAKLTFVDIDDKRHVRSVAQIAGQCAPCGLCILSGYQDVINVDEQKIQCCTDRVDHVLDGLGGVLQPKRNSEEFIEPKRSDDCPLGMSAAAIGIWW